MKWIAFILAVIVILGPLRRAFLRRWRFNVPAVLAGFASWLIVSNIMSSHDPWWMPWAVGVFVALGAGAAVREWLDEVFGKGGK
jgi:hypothetical protein